VSISIAMVRALVAAAGRAGVSKNELLAAAELDPVRLDDVHGQVSLAEYERVRQSAVQLSGDEALGLHLAQDATSPAFDVLGHLTAHATTLRQAIETLTRYARIVSVGPFAELVEQDDTALVRFAFPQQQASPKLRFAAELALSGFMRLVRAFAGGDALPRGVYFAYGAPAHRAEYARVFAGRERFDHAFTGIEFERAWLERTQPYANPELYGVLQAQADRVLGRIEREVSLVDRVEELLATRDARSMPAMTDVARELGMSTRSLRRKLADEHAAYKDLVERKLIREAKRLLENPRASIQEAAYGTGFRTAAAFHRAFRRWTGMTPAEYRAAF
jgi:AraC-like DNA-binding protein